MKTLPSGLTPYKRTPTFTEGIIPKGLLKAHSTKAGTWGRIVIEAGALWYRISDPPEAVRLVPGVDGIVEPEALHEVEADGEVRFFVEFLR